MGASPVFDFEVKSSVHDYEVKFVNDVPNILKNEIKDGDVIIIDNKVKKLYPDLLRGLNDNISVIGLDAHEEQKSYKGIKPIIQKLIDGGFRRNYRLIGIGGGITQASQWRMTADRTNPSGARRQLHRQ